MHRTRSGLVRSLDTGLPTVGLAEGLVQSWPLLGTGQRAPVIAAVRRRLAATLDVGVQLSARPKLAGRAQLVELLRLLDAGCESELELWGYRAVFDRPEFQHACWQLPIRTPGPLPHRPRLRG
ncbi:hypothetical protein [Jatrophihabitans sp.]|uniref:hypothetical protein n=1 Tax=Jatrophihabitans sp. TaxID=1932789 RepID=UPI002F1EC6B6